MLDALAKPSAFDHCIKTVVFTLSIFQILEKPMIWHVFRVANNIGLKTSLVQEPNITVRCNYQRSFIEDSMILQRLPDFHSFL